MCAKFNLTHFIAFFFLITSSTIILAQEDFNESKRFGAELQVGPTVTALFGDDSFSVSPMFIYKIKKQVLFLGYERLKRSNSNYSYNGIRVGYRIYPHANKKKLKIYYLAMYSVRWQVSTNHGKDIVKREMYGNLGFGFDYHLSKNIYLGYENYIGVGEKDHDYGNYTYSEGITYDAQSLVTLKYFFN